MGLSTFGYPGIGIAFDTKDAVVYNRTATTLALGDVVMFDMGNTDGDTGTTTALGAKASIFSNVIVPATAGIGGVASDVRYIFGCVIDLLDGAGADNALVKVRIEGPCKVNVAAAVDLGDLLQPADGIKTLNDTSVAGVVFIAWAREAGSTSVECIFDGFRGFGSNFAS